MPYFRNEGHYRSEDLSRDKVLGALSHGGNKNLAGLANFDFRLFMTSHENQQLLPLQAPFFFHAHFFSLFLYWRTGS